jgi:fructose-bisphosphate aldolase class II
MPLSTTAALVEKARASGCGVPAFNVITLEHAEAIAEGAERAGTAAILQISENAVRFHNGRLAPLATATAAVAEAAEVPLSVHFDHVEDAALFEQVPGTGISSVMVDASTLELSANVAATRQAADWGHARDLWVEAELGEVGGKDGAHAPGVRTDPDEARRYVEATGVDGLAVAVGSSHAMVDRTARLDLDLIARLTEAVPVPLVLHGSSGVPDDVLSRAVAGGIVKVNIGTILNVAFTGHIREYLAGEGSSVDPRRYLRGARGATADVVARLAAVIAAPERLT